MRVAGVCVAFLSGETEGTRVLNVGDPSKYHLSGINDRPRRFAVKS